MPLIINNYTTPDYISGVWEMSENFSELYNLCKLTDYDKEYLSQITSPQRQKELLSVRALLLALNLDIEIKYNGRKPICNKGFISISHSKDFATIIWHLTQKTTIDIEKISERILKISERAFSEKEIQMVNNNIEGLTKLWCAKECVYKYFDYSELDFRTNIQITAINEVDKTINCCLIVDKKRFDIDLFFMKIRDNFLVWESKYITRKIPLRVTLPSYKTPSF